MKHRQTRKEVFHGLFVCHAKLSSKYCCKGDKIMEFILGKISRSCTFATTACRLTSKAS
jgi:hypothetical protein